LLDSYKEDYCDTEAGGTMTLLTVTNDICCRMINKSNMTGTTSGTGTAYPYGESELTHVLVGFVLPNF